jgi:hypothetical protein
MINLPKEFFRRLYPGRRQNRKDDETFWMLYLDQNGMSSGENM